MIIKPEVSVIMSTNHGDVSLRKTIESVLSQTLPDFEFILIDDGSSDDTAAICQEYARRDGRVKYIRFESPAGSPATRYNDGIELSTGRYLSFMHSGDTWLPNALVHLYRAISTRYRHHGMVYGLVDDENKNRSTSDGRKLSARQIKQGNFIASTAVIIKREIIDFVGGYDENLCSKHISDWDLWVRICSSYLIAGIPVLVGTTHHFPSTLKDATIPMNNRQLRLKTKTLGKGEAMVKFASDLFKDKLLALRSILGGIKRYFLRCFYAACKH
ncbi:MAG: glycosyltransferase [Parachlamydiaceae bacterium]